MSSYITQNGHNPPPFTLHERCSSESESYHHYLFECPVYNHIHSTLFDKLRQIPSSACLQTLLFGDHSQSLSDNKRVFEAVHSFIIASKRFN